MGMYPPFLKEKSPVRKRDEAEFPRGRLRQNTLLYCE